MESLKTEETYEQKLYPKNDGVVTFDILESVARSGTQHDHDQPSHLKIKPGLETANQESLLRLGGIEEKFCPAKVYEFVENEEGKKELVINAQNCIHCKTCDIKVKINRWSRITFIGMCLKEEKAPNSKSN